MAEAKELAAVRAAGERFRAADQEYRSARMALAVATVAAKGAGLDPAKVHDAAGLTRSKAARLAKEVTAKR